MPQYTFADETGRKVTVEGDSPPTESELEQIFAQTAPKESPAQQQQAPLLTPRKTDWLSLANEMRDMVGGEILDPTTRQPVYKERSEDEKAFKLQALAQQQAQLQKEAADQERLANSGLISSAASGAALAGPMMPFNIGKAIGDATGAKNMPREYVETLDLLNKELMGRASANPYAGATGSAATQVAMMGAGGAPINLGKGLIALKEGNTALAKELLLKAGMEHLKAVPASVGVGAGIRAVTGEEITPQSIGLDAALAGIGGRVKSEAPQFGRSTTVDLERGMPVSGSAVGTRLREEMEPIPVGATNTRSTASSQPAPELQPEKAPSSNRFIRAAADTITDIRDEYSQKPMRLFNSAIKMPKKLGALTPSGEMEGERIVREAVPHILDSGVKVTGFTTLLEGIRVAKQKIWSQIEDALGEAENQNLRVSGDELGNSMLKVADGVKLNIEDRAGVEAVIQRALDYQGRTFTPKEAEQLLQETNQALASYYQKTGVSERVARADPYIAVQLELAANLRKQLYDLLGQATKNNGSKFADLKRNWGSLHTLEEHSAGQYMVNSRQQLMSLNEKQAALGSPVKIITARFNKAWDSPDAKIQAAFQKWEKEGLGNVSAPPKKLSPQEELEEAMRELGKYPENQGQMTDIEKQIRMQKDLGKMSY